MPEIVLISQFILQMTPREMSGSVPNHIETIPRHFVDVKAAKRFLFHTTIADRFVLSA
jgi:hypothetical protein